MERTKGSVTTATATETAQYLTKVIISVTKVDFASCTCVGAVRFELRRGRGEEMSGWHDVVR